jgi:hypothetical protein
MPLRITGFENRKTPALDPSCENARHATRE